MNDAVATDADLLRQYVEGSEAAFRELVRRHLGMVHATARRILATAPHLADDVTQTVFTDLAKQAPTLSPGVVLGGWLHRHACYLALNAARAEHRRHARERTAMEINALNENSGQDAQWAQLAPILDDALNHLGDQDRAAIVLRYLEQLDLRSIGVALGLSEDAAQKRVARALEKLREYLVRSGVTVASATALGTTLEASPVAPATPELATTISDVALSGVAAVGTIAFILNSLKIMFTSKLALGLTAVVAVGITVHILTQNAPGPSSAAAPASVKVYAPVPKTLTGQVISAQVEAPKAAPAVPHDAAPAAQTTNTNSMDSNVMRVANFPNEDILTIIQSVAKQFKLNVHVPNPPPTGTATVDLQNATWQEIFKSVLDPIGYTYVDDGGMITIIKSAPAP
jgi:RNA polymerase sigma factor (sigma-70 family)